MRSFSAAAVKQFFAQDADDPLICLLTIASGDNSLYFANSYTGRLTSLETDEFTTVYGVTSRGLDFVFLPFSIALPNDDDAAPRAQITLHDVTREAMPLIRSATSAPTVRIELVLASAPNTVEMVLDGLTMTAINYNRETITADLTVDTLAAEPFPAHAFVPAHFPGLF